MNIYLEAALSAKASAVSERDGQRHGESPVGAESLAIRQAETFVRSFVIPELLEAGQSLRLCQVECEVVIDGAPHHSGPFLDISGIAHPLVFTASWTKASGTDSPVPVVHISDGVNADRDCHLEAGEIRRAILAFVTNSIRELVSRT